MKKTLSHRRFAMLAGLALGTCLNLGAGCIQAALAIISETFF